MEGPTSMSEIASEGAHQHEDWVMSHGEEPKAVPCEADQVPTVYLTKEQIMRLTGLACDALVGIQMHTDASDRSYVYGEYAHIDHGELEHFTIAPDGTYRSTT